MIPQETVNRILDAAQITDVVGDFVTLKKRGANHMACCPFHNEIKASVDGPRFGNIERLDNVSKSPVEIMLGIVLELLEHLTLAYVPISFKMRSALRWRKSLE